MSLPWSEILARFTVWWLTIEITPGPQAYSSILISLSLPASVSSHWSLSQNRCFNVCSDSVFMESANLSLYSVAILLQEEKKSVSALVRLNRFPRDYTYSKYLRLASVKSVMVNVVGNFGSNGFCMSSHINLNALKGVEKVVWKRGNRSRQLYLNCEGRTVFKRRLGDISDTSDILNIPCQEAHNGASESSRMRG